MSDTESGDDGFDREAEKERLREKYEAEKADRQTTERMSELLLQGATMTNKHCDACGNPIFRYENQEFCSVCDVDDGGQVQATRDGQQQAASAADQQQPTDGQQAAGGQPADGQQQSGAADATDPVDNARASTDQPAQDAGASADRSTPTPQSSPTREPTPQETAGAAGDADLDAARASLARTVTDLSRRAEETRDASHARDLLAAAREAAEALAELERLR